jgi:chromosome segregation ATPase
MNTQDKIDANLVEVLVAIGRIEGKIESMSDKQQQVADRIQKLELRIAELEMSRAWFLGWAAAIATVASVIAKYAFP